eukprot:CAMPEP_0180066330 /NCGR_PEP_ID=MMETSP0985-20121206/9236_1 /TAXON_ID=483367 /ORGANISM="non described non described, Strain CCMP 2436" /LENGTH=31 /DNA_ID= /DNA_START= /DNA_END= /DNA_ORIENTATION=
MTAHGMAAPVIVLLREGTSRCCGMLTRTDVR